MRASEHGWLSGLDVCAKVSCLYLHKTPTTPSVVSIELKDCVSERAHSIVYDYFAPQACRTKYIAYKSQWYLFVSEFRTSNKYLCVKHKENGSISARRSSRTFHLEYEREREVKAFDYEVEIIQTNKVLVNNSKWNSQRKSFIYESVLGLALNCLWSKYKEKNDGDSVLSCQGIKPVFKRAHGAKSGKLFL